MKIIVVPNAPIMAARHYRIAKTLIEQGHEVHYMMWALPYNIKPSEMLKHLFTSMISRTYKHENITVHTARRLPYFWPFINGWIFKHQIRNLYNRLGADIIFTESFTNETEVPRDLPFIYDLADDYAAPADVYGSPIYKLAFKLLGIRNVMKRQCQNAIAVTAVSDILYKFAKQHNNNVHMLRNGIDKETIEATLKAMPIQPVNKHSMIYVTRFGQWSRAIETLEATVALKKEFPDLELHLVGEGTESKKMLAFIKKQKAESYIHYHGFIYDRKKMYNLMSQSPIGLNISDKNKWRDAAHPIKVIEYSAFGMKVVSTDLREVEALHHPNVFTFSDANKETSLVNVMRKALLTDTGYADYKAVSTKTLREYDWLSIADGFIELADASIKHRTPYITHVSSAYSPALGGLEKVVASLAHEQQESGNNVQVITSNQRVKSLRNIDDNGVRVTRLRSFVVANTTIMPSLFFRLLRLPRDTIIHLHITQAFAPEVVWLVSKIRGYEYVVQVHFHLDAPPIGVMGFLLEFYKKRILSRVLKDAKAVIVMTKDYQDKIASEYSVPRDKLIIIPNATEHSITPKKNSTPSSPLRLLSTGRLSSQKNVSFLLDCLARYAKDYNSDFHLDITGDGEQKSELEAKVKKLGLSSHVTFQGRVSDDELQKYYQRADIFLSASMFEAFGLVMIEAMTKGTPIVSTNILNVRNVVKDHRNGLLVRQDVTEFAAAIHTLATDKKLYKSISQDNVVDAKQYRWDAVNAKCLEVYRG